MSKIRHSQAAPAPLAPAGDESLGVSGVAADFEPGHRIPRHRHRRAQLVYAVEGAMTVRTDAGLWVVPAHRALWLPAGVEHSIRMTARVRMRTVYFGEDALARATSPRRPTVLAVTPLMREAVVRIVEGPAPSKAEDGARRDRVVAVLLDELAAADATPLEVPIPADPRLRRVADALMKDPSDTRGAAAWARVAGVSGRSLARLFPAQTGLTFVRWRQQVRLLHALERLAVGDAVTSVALDLGYTSTSAFVKLFRESFGVTPGRYFASGEPRVAVPGRAGTPRRT